jgi:hypothetical protein
MNMRHFSLKEFKDNKSGVFWVLTVGITTILIVDILWGFLMLVLNHFLDAFLPLSTMTFTTYLGETSVLMGNITVLVINIGMIAWMVISAFKHENQDVPEYMIG